MTTLDRIPQVGETIDARGFEKSFGGKVSVIDLFTLQIGS
jgi:hypothetical protein